MITGLSLHFNCMVSGENSANQRSIIECYEQHGNALAVLIHGPVAWLGEAWEGKAEAVKEAGPVVRMLLCYRTDPKHQTFCTVTEE